MSGYGLAVGLCIGVVLLLFLLLRTRRVREKYAAMWLLLALGVCVFGIFPNLAFALADLLGVQTPVNLVFSGAMVVLLLVCIQLSVEVSNLEEETRTIAEEVAMLKLDVQRLREADEARVAPPDPGADPE
ncbi:DUF2304 domain-containing protein [Actinotalea ferrariae]|uniref:DUF2304 domain-containing protein n=1 Tax=Actinotalea ferrariae TaxID=1386098 RepID=UPI001C8C95CC|nr:DUF2304 domain-containing protein [Actinotalea ferrariae]MBX9243468.1 DUF2304 domain-containing protein [Actinotalea ferrariae]